MSFENLNLHASIMKAIADSGYTQPTPIQTEAIPEVIAGHDLMASAQTGSGKTAAFIMPALNRLATPSTLPGKGPRVLVLTPTRELAQQVCEAANQYGKFMRFKIISVVGGMPYPVQNRLLSGQVDIMVATPGRLIDHLERGRIDFSRMEMLILDEADRMLDMGFVDDVERIAAATPATRQTLLFSATLDGVVGNLASRLLKTPKRITISAGKDKHENIEQRMIFADDVAHKNKLLSHLLTDPEVNQAIVFMATKRDTDSVADLLSAQGHSVAALHGDMSQRERNRTLTNMRSGNIRILVATDVAARGLDVRGISHVINFDLPKVTEDYVHRIGRTGRGGSNGIAISFASNRDAQLLKRIERYTEQTIKMHVIEGLEAKYKLRTGGSDRPGNGGPRRGGFGGNSGSGYAGNRSGGFGGNRSSAFAGNGNNGGAGFHHAAPDSRHSHVGRKEGHGQWHGQANAPAAQGFTGQRQERSPTAAPAQARTQDRSFGNAPRGNSAPRREGSDRPGFGGNRPAFNGNRDNKR
ncbi:MAG: RNA helicase [Gallionellales bacterium CG_4_10_14_3_um_filter_54_96]|nr:MAG: RNA helicase [Gallionellaceae bacterium CG1_02_56_997]PIV15421.1 MAG: RNA helicase [Gallionellales bacterium CG03_land_8_20_14_0_80_55_15]PIV91030.1 MAG: RNA helicase [Gallionellales bacterium CG17_big_fil_post_rev_8_21_14_2_50_54_146]PIX03840.1 MAG: RNA helicase [Gallionellales bacterium CG_4_8_14_3_um_filter_54_18]PIY04888.1 MAG: RNA helicase [Gallionellales bacterium CG_4_10_14_3_um_filter_54_96]PJC05096.1 MAG: RNA helicase [Gallionellales bacterium CG_4_9_14_0_8_um_filter_55_61]HC